MKNLYQHLYNDTDYNRKDKTENCPGVKYYSYYEKWLRNPVYDWGCGNGRTVKFLREQGRTVSGMDWVDLKNGMDVGDITKPHSIEHETAICMDVLEHIPLKKIRGILKNIQQSNRQVFSISNGQSIVEGVELHITRLSFYEWEKALSEYYNVKEIKIISDEVRVFLCQR